MALTLTKLLNAITHQLGGAAASQLDTTELVNQGGRLLCQMHPWRFNIRPPTTLDFTADTAYVALPSDYGEMTALKFNANLLNLFTLGTTDELAELRASNVLPPAVYRGAVVQPTQAAVTSVPPVQRLELAPIPTATVSAALALWYRAKWTEISSGTDVPNVPIQANLLLEQLVRAVAAGTEENDNGIVDQRVAVIKQGPVFEALVDWDSANQVDYGPLGAGAIAFRNTPSEYWAELADPS